MIDIVWSAYILEETLPIIQWLPTNLSWGDVATAHFTSTYITGFEFED